MNPVFLYFAVLCLRGMVVDPQTPFFRVRIFSDLPGIVVLFELLGCMFDASLMPILCSGHPPSLDSIVSLVEADEGDLFWKDKWGVYIVVLERRRRKPILYVGCSMNTQAGLHARFCDYRGLVSKQCPRYVIRAMNEGYKVTRIMVPFYFTKPSEPQLLGFAQTAVLAVEHALTFRLWTMVGKWEGCESLALWDKSRRPYDGANCHSNMYETRSLEEISPDEIAEYLRERKERNRQKHLLWLAENQERVKTTKKQWADDHKEHRKAQKREWNDENREHVNDYQRKRAKEAKETAQFPCDVCNLPFANPRELNRHKESDVACKPVRDAARAVRLTCDGCGREFSQMANLERHRTTKVCLAERTLADMTCPVCGRVIKNKGNMQKHLATHRL